MSDYYVRLYRPKDSRKKENGHIHLFLTARDVVEFLAPRAMGCRDIIEVDSARVLVQELKPKFPAWVSDVLTLKMACATSPDNCRKLK